MRLKLACVILGAILMARGDARPQEIGTNETAIPEVTKEVEGVVDDASNQDVRSRYRSSTLGSRNIKEFYNKLNQGGFTPGIISSIGQSRRSKLPQNWILYSPSNTSKSQNDDKTKLQETNLRGFRNEMNLRHAARISIADDEFALSKKLGTRNSGQRTTTKAPTLVKNLVLIRPANYPTSMTIPRPNKKTNVTAIRKFSKGNVTIPNRFSTIRKPEYFSQHLKNWPNDPPRGIQDFINYEKYTTSTEEVSKKPTSSILHRKPSKPNVLIYPKKPDIHDFSIHPDPMSQPNVQEIIQWLQIPPFTSLHNQSKLTQEFQPGESFSNTFKPGFESNLPLTTVKTLPITLINDEHLNDFIFPEENNNHHHYEAIQSTKNPVTTVSEETVSTAYSVIDDIPTDTSIYEKPPRPIFRPFSEVSQNTVVHIINPLSKKPNVTVSEGQTPQTNVSTTKPSPNVHIMFMPPKDDNKESHKNTLGQQSPFNKDSDCPTITINSITKVNNTFLSKEGCTDLNIVINSQVLSTNNFGSGIFGYDEGGQDKYSDVKDEYPNSQDDIYTLNSDTSPSPPQYNPSNTDKDDLFDGSDKEPVNSEDYDVNQENDVQYEETNRPEGEVSEANDAVGSEISDSPAEDSSNVGNGPMGASSSGEAISGSAGQSEAVGQSNDAIVSSSAGQLPGIPNLPSLGNQGLGSGGNGGGESTALATIDDDDDDDDDDIFDLTPSGILESMTSVFAYFTFLNPLNYGIFSLAAAPFAALAAGILGVAALFFPWAFTSGFGFARAADKVTIKFRPNLEEVVRQSIHDYRSLQEWKSKRKKSRRR